MGNIVNGIDLTRRVLDQEIYGPEPTALAHHQRRPQMASPKRAIWLNGDMLFAV